MSQSKERTAQELPSISAGVASDAGVVRDLNEDAYGHFSSQSSSDCLFIVADGMGGHTRGREASRTTVDVVQTAFYDQFPDDSELDALKTAFEQANREVYRTSVDDEEATMGTTATALMLRSGFGYVAHVGDSRLYRFDRNGAQQLTKDHTVAEVMRRKGYITDEQAKTHPRRGVLVRAIGVEPTVEIETFRIDSLRAGDRFLLCTDGLQELSTRVLRNVVLKNAPQEACKRLVQRANDRGGHDNATALVVQLD